MLTVLRALLISLTGIWVLAGCNDSLSGDSAGSDTGTAGSTARFAIQRDYLVVIGTDNLKVFDLRTPNDPLVVYETVVPSADVQTIFPYLDDYLMLGAEDGMYIYRIDDAGRTTSLGFMTHGRACDPVVAADDVAYVTLNDIEQCGEAALNELHVVDVADLTQPTLVTTEPMAGPKGLAVSGTDLFVCDKHALARFDITEPTQPELLVLDGTIHCDDVIVQDDLLYATGDRVSIYRIEPYSEDSSGLTRLSTLPGDDAETEDEDSSTTP